MVNIPNIASQPPEQSQEPQQFHPRINAEVRPDVTVFQLQHTPIDIRLLPVPNEIMAQVVALWLEQHPQDAIAIIADIKRKIKQNGEILHFVQATKNS